MADKKSYKELQSEFETIVAWFESDDFDLDKAGDKYAEAQRLIRELEAYLKSAENKITKIKAQFGD